MFQVSSIQAHIEMETENEKDLDAMKMQIMIANWANMELFQEKEKLLHLSDLFVDCFDCPLSTVGCSSVGPARVPFPVFRLVVRSFQTAPSQY